VPVLSREVDGQRDVGSRRYCRAAFATSGTPKLARSDPASRAPHGSHEVLDPGLGADDKCASP